VTDSPPAVTARAPAKLNLGLAVLGRRADGYHDLATIMQAIDRWDDLRLAPAPTLAFAGDDPAEPGSTNLALVALRRLLDHAGLAAGATIRLDKRIPVAAGLGGASSDAAAALLAGRRLLAPSLPDAALADLAAGLGSDVPFFLRGGTALATGRGDLLEPLPTPSDLVFLVVAPDVAIPRKTATLYAALTPSDVSDGTAVREQAGRLRRGQPLLPALLANAFSRPLTALRPDLAELPPLMRRLGAPDVALSGAGPSHYAVFDDPAAAERTAHALRAHLGRRASVFLARPVPTGATVDREGGMHRALPITLPAQPPRPPRR